MPGQARAFYMTAHPIATQFPVHKCMDDLPIERDSDSQATRVIDVPGLFFTFYPWMFVQPGTGRRVVDWCKN